MNHNMKNNFYGLSLIALFAVSCTQTKDIKATVIEEDKEVAANTAPSAIVDPSATVGSSNTPVVAGQQIQVPAAGITGGLNPEHGKPGHRCDIAVGQPLNSPAGGGAPAPAMAAPAPMASPAANQTVAPGMNPPHGEPGHRCDISVGAPLNSPAAQK